MIDCINLLIFSHAVLKFRKASRVTEILDGQLNTVLGKKVFALPAHSSFYQNFPKLGQGSSEETKDTTETVQVTFTNLLFIF